MGFETGNIVWLSVRNIKTTRPSKKLDYKRVGPYTVNKVIKKNAYKLDLLNMMCIHNIFHVSVLTKYSPYAIGQPLSELQPMIVDESDKWEVERILDFKQCY